MTKQDGLTDAHKIGVPLATEVMELLLSLPAVQFSILEETACRFSLTVGQLIRRTVSDFLRDSPL